MCMAKTTRTISNGFFRVMWSGKIFDIKDGLKLIDIF